MNNIMFSIYNIIHKLFMALEDDVALETDWNWEEPVDGNTTAGMIE